MAKTYIGTFEFERVRKELITAAEYHGLTTYQDVALLMGIPLAGRAMGSDTGLILGEISRAEVDAGRPMLSAVAVKKGELVPGGGFFDLAEKLGRMRQGQDPLEFWRAESRALYDCWSRSRFIDSYLPKATGTTV